MKKPQPYLAQGPKGICGLTYMKNSGCSHRNRSTGRNEPVEEHEEASLGPAEFEVMVDGNVKETRICHHKIGMLL